MSTKVMKQKMSVPKKICISLASILMVAMLLVCLWWVFIYFLGPEKLIEKTFNWDYITTTAENKQQILKVNYFSNKNQNGLELFEMDWTYFQDETKNNTYSQGLQYVAVTENDTINFAFTIDNDQEPKADPDDNFFSFPMNYMAYDCWGGYKVDAQTTEYYNYMSSNNYQTTTTSTNPLGLDSKLKIELGEDRENTYLMVPKGVNTEIDGEPEKIVFFPVNMWNIGMYRYYCYYDYNYLAKIVYDSVKGMAGGTDTNVVFEFGDYFDYYQYKDSHYGERLTKKQLADGKVIAGIKSYCVVHINVSDDGADSYTDSMFNMIKNDATFNLNPERVTDDYFTGRTLIKVDNNAFDFVKVHENKIALKLKESFVNEYLPVKDSIILDVEINIDKIKEQGYEYFGLCSDHGLNQFKLKSIHTVDSSSGHEVKEEVQL